MRFFKNIEPIRLLFYFSFVSIIIVTVFFERKLLIYTLPITILFIGILYIQHVRKIDPWYILSLMVMIISDILIYEDFTNYFSEICILIGVFFLLSSLSLRKFIAPNKLQWSTILSFPFILCAFLILYLIYAISQLLLPYVLAALPFVIICLAGSLTFTITSYIVYITDKYEQGITLVTVVGLCVFIVALLPINELFFYSRIFTVLLNITHILSLYLFMTFLVSSKSKKTSLEDKDYL